MNQKQLVLLLCACVGLAPSVSAATWVGISSDWGAAGNWSGGVPGAGTEASFATLLNGQSFTPTIADPRQVGRLTFDSGGASFSIGGAGSLVINGMAGVGLANNNTVPQTLAVASLSLGASQTWNNNGTLTVNGGTLNLGGNTLRVDGTGMTHIPDGISGTGGLEKNGSGSLSLSGPNAFSGGVIIRGGTVNVSSATAFGNSTIISVMDATLNLNETLNFATPFPPSLSLGPGAVVNQGTSQAAFGDLEILGNSAINLGASGELTFDTAGYSAGLLTINGWNGPAFVPNTPNSGGTGARIFITENPASSGLLSHVQFNGPNGPYPLGAAWLSDTFELVPVPEPQTYAAVFALALVGFAAVRRRWMAAA